MALQQIIYNALNSPDKAIRQQNTELYFQYTQQPDFFSNLVELILNDNEMLPQYSILATKYIQKQIQNNGELLQQISDINVLAKLLQKLIQIEQEQTGRLFCKTIGMYQAAISFAYETDQSFDSYSCMKEFSNNVLQQPQQLYHMYLVYIWLQIIEYENDANNIAELVIQMMCFLLDKIDFKYHYLIYQLISQLYVQLKFRMEGEIPINIQMMLKDANQKLTQNFLYMLDQNSDQQIICKTAEQFTQILYGLSPDMTISFENFQAIIQKLINKQNIDMHMIAIQFVQNKFYEFQYVDEYDASYIQQQLYLTQVVQEYVLPLLGTAITQEYINDVLSSTHPEYVEQGNCSFSNIVYSFMDMARCKGDIILQAFNQFMEKNKNIYTDNVVLAMLFTITALSQIQLITTQQILLIYNEYNIANTQNPIVLLKLYQIYFIVLSTYPRSQDLIEFEKILMEQVTPQALNQKLTNNYLILKLFIIELINQIISNEKVEFISKYNVYLTQVVSQFILDSNICVKAKIIQLIKSIIQNQPNNVAFFAIIKEHIEVTVGLLRQIQLNKYQINLYEKQYLEEMISLLRELLQNKNQMNALLQQNAINVSELLQIILDILKRDDQSFDDSISSVILQLTYNSLYYCKNQIQDMIQDIFQIIMIMINKTSLEKAQTMYQDDIQRISSYTLDIRKGVLQLLKVLMSIMQNNFIPYVDTSITILKLLFTGYLDKGLSCKIISQLIFICVENNQVQHLQQLYEIYFESPVQFFMCPSFHNHIQSIILVLTSLIRCQEKQLFMQQQVEQWMKKTYDIIIQHIKNILQSLNPTQQFTQEEANDLEQFNEQLDIIGSLFEFLSSDQSVSQMLQGIQLFISNKSPTLATQLLQQQIYYSILQTTVRLNRQTQIDISNTFEVLITQSMSGYQINTITMKLLTLMLTHYKNICLPIIVNNIQPLQEQCNIIINQKTQIKIENISFWYYIYFVLSYSIQIYPTNVDILVMVIQCIINNLIFVQKVEYEIFILLESFLKLQQQNLQLKEQGVVSLLNDIIILFVNMFCLEDVQEQLNDEQNQWAMALINQNGQLVQDRQELLLISTKNKLQQLFSKQN